MILENIRSWAVSTGVEAVSKELILWISAPAFHKSVRKTILFYT